MVKIGVIGARGRMGIHLCDSTVEHPNAEISALLEHPEHNDIGRTFYDNEVTADWDTFLSKSDVIIDFTSPEATMKLLKLNEKYKKPLVIGTTGLNSEELNQIDEAAKIFPVVFSPNYSIGVNVLLKALADVGQILSKEKGYDLELVELHHRFKKDSPSGTALKLAEVAATASGRDLAKNGVYGREGMVGERSIDEVGVFAVRAGDIIGEHTVIFSTLGERVEIGHKAHSRQTFSKGAVEAAVWLGNQKPGLYTMKEVLGL